MSDKSSAFPRYLRVVDHLHRLDDIDDPLMGHKEMQPVSPLEKPRWLSNYVCAPAHLSLSSIESILQKTRIEVGLFPMDVSSALPVLALDLPSSQNCKVLDLCCAPGGKLQYISELISPSSLVVGVDVSIHRLHTCQSILEQWLTSKWSSHLSRQMIFHCDGTSFDAKAFGQLVYDSNIIKQELHHRGDRKHLNKSHKMHRLRSYQEKEVKLLQSASLWGNAGSSNVSCDSSNDNNSVLNDFDYVLVDAECTHDASYRHLHLLHKNKHNDTPLMATDSTTLAAAASSSSVVAAEKKTNKSRPNKIYPQHKKKSRNSSYNRESWEDINVDDVDWGDEEIIATVFVDNNKLTTTSTVDTSMTKDVRHEGNRAYSHEDGLTSLEGCNEVIQVQETSAFGSKRASSPPTLSDRAPSHGPLLSHGIEDISIVNDKKIQLQTSQRSLLANGFRLLKVGGTLVYSTCSHDTAQNEEIISWLLTHHADAELVPALPAYHTLPYDTILPHGKELFSIEEQASIEDRELLSTKLCEYYCRLEQPILFRGYLPETIRVDFRSGMSGHFLAKIRKKEM